MTNVKLVLMTNVDMYQFIEKGMHGGMAGLICRSQAAGRRPRVAGHCFTNTESILNILKS